MPASQNKTYVTHGVQEAICIRGVITEYLNLSLWRISSLAKRVNLYISWPILLYKVLKFFLCWYFGILLHIPVAPVHKRKNWICWQQNLDWTQVCRVGHALWSNTLIHFILWTRWIAALFELGPICWAESLMAKPKINGRHSKSTPGSQFTFSSSKYTAQLCKKCLKTESKI